MSQSNIRRSYTYSVDPTKFTEYLHNESTTVLLKAVVDITNITSSPTVSVKNLVDFPECSIKYSISARVNRNRVFSDESKCISKADYLGMLSKYPECSTTRYTQYIISIPDLVHSEQYSLSVYVPHDEYEIAYMDLVTTNPKLADLVRSKFRWMMGRCKLII